MTERKHLILAFDEFRLDVPKRQLWRDGELVPLTAKAFELLLALAENSGREITKDELLNRVWHDQFVEENNLTVHISAIRKALGDRADQPRYIVTLAGRGYRFVREVHEIINDDSPLIVEQHTLTRIVVEEENSSAAANDVATADAPTGEAETPGAEPTTRTPITARAALTSRESPAYTAKQRASTGTFKAIAAILLVAMGGAFAVYRYVDLRLSAPPFERFEIKRQTNSGGIIEAVSSADGRYIAFARIEPEGQSLWLKHVATGGSTLIVEPRPLDYWGLSFTPDGNYIYATTFERNEADPVLSKIAVIGGASQRLPVVTTTAVSFSPDNRRMAYVVSSSSTGSSILWIADTDGANRQAIHIRKEPDFFAMEGNTVAWSPDGATIACAVLNNTGGNFYMTITSYSVNGGTERQLTAHRWNIVNSVAWTANGRGLMLTGNEKMGAPLQVWFVSAAGGQARQITNDLNSYSGVSLNSDGDSLVTVQTDTTSGIWTGAVEADGRVINVRQNFSEVGEIAAIGWTPDGDIVYQSAASGTQELWLLDLPSGQTKQLTFDSLVSNFAVAPDGQHVILVSRRAGKPNLWRMDADGGKIEQLTRGDGETHPRFTPDNQFIFFQKGFGEVQSSVWKICAQGGDPQPVTKPHQSFPDLSPDGRLIAYSYMDKSAPGVVQWRLGVAASVDGELLASFAVPSSVTNRLTRWTPDNRALTYITTVGSASNLWLQPIGGGAAQRLTDFSSHHIEAFDWSRDGQRLAVVRTLKTSDVISLESAK